MFWTWFLIQELNSKYVNSHVNFSTLTYNKAIRKKSIEMSKFEKNKIKQNKIQKILDRSYSDTAPAFLFYN